MPDHQYLGQLWRCIPSGSLNSLRLGVGSRGLTRPLLVDRFTLSVSDFETGEIYDSDVLLDLRRAITLSHSVPTLTPSEAMQLVQNLDVFNQARRRVGKCAAVEMRLDRVPVDSIWFQILTTCNRSTDEDIVPAVVNLRTGIIMDPRTVKELASDSIGTVRRAVLAQAAERRAIAIRQLAERCHY